MFGVYSNQRISEAESKILYGNPDDYNWYMVVISQIFKDKRMFEIREDIELPQNDDEDGVVLIFEGGNVVYFKTLEGDVTKEKYKSIMKVCNYLEDLFKRPIESYILCKPGYKMKIKEAEGKGDITIYFSAIGSHDGEKIIDTLESKLKKNQPFTVFDSADHMLLPFTGYKNKKEKEKKFRAYMEHVEEFAQGY